MDTFGKSAQAILDKLLENPADTPFDLEPLVYKSLKKKLPKLYDAIDSYITPEQVGKLKVIKAHYESLESWKAELEELILELATPYQQELAILQTAPGICSDFTDIGIISEISTNMEAFPSVKHLCSWAGLTPTDNESAGKKNLSGFPRPDAISNLCWSSVQMLLLPVKSIRKFATTISVSKSVAVTRNQSLPLQKCL